MALAKRAADRERESVPLEAWPASNHGSFRVFRRDQFERKTTFPITALIVSALLTFHETDFQPDRLTPFDPFAILSQPPDRRSADALDFMSNADRSELFLGGYALDVRGPARRKEAKLTAPELPTRARIPIHSRDKPRDNG